MKVLDIQNINSDFDEFAKAKADIENFWYKNKQNKIILSLTDFLLKLQLNNKIFLVDENTPIPFYFIETDNDLYLFVCSTNNNEEAVNSLIKYLFKCEFKIIENSKEIDNVTLALEDKTMPDFPYFIINNKYYTLSV